MKKTEIIKNFKGQTKKNLVFRGYTGSGYTVKDIYVSEKDGVYTYTYSFGEYFDNKFKLSCYGGSFETDTFTPAVKAYIKDFLGIEGRVSWHK